MGYTGYAQPLPFFLRLHTCSRSAMVSWVQQLQVPIAFVTLLCCCQRCQCLTPHLPKPRRSERVGAVGFFSFQAVQDESTMLHAWKQKKYLKTSNQSGFLHFLTINKVDLYHVWCKICEGKGSSSLRTFGLGLLLCWFHRFRCLVHLNRSSFSFRIFPVTFLPNVKFTLQDPDWASCSIQPSSASNVAGSRLQGK